MGFGDPKAEEYFQKAIKIKSSILGVGHPELNKSYRNLAELYKSKGRPHDADNIIRKIK